MKTICINCRPLADKLTGIERCIYEYIKRFDQLATSKGLNIELLYPAGMKIQLPENTAHLKKVPIKANGNNMDRLALRKYIKSKGALYVSMHGGACVVSPAIVCINDLRPLLFKKYDPFMTRFKYRVNFTLAKLLGAKIVTISQTSRNEISDVLKIKKTDIEVIYPGWEHILENDPDTSIWSRLNGVEKGKYFYSLSSRAPHKNFKWVEKIAARNPDIQFLIGGKLWENSKNGKKILKNVHYLGYVTDSENVELMKYCRAFIHPSKYEGFGMTPLEAYACGAEICVSKASCLPEIFEDCAHYFDPDNYNLNLEKILSQPCKKNSDLLRKYSWDKSAAQWIALFEKYAKDPS